MKKLFNFIQVLDNLSRIPRTGGVLFAGIDPNRTDSISEHSYKVSCICYLLSKIFEKNGITINKEALLITAITHDWSDSVLLDVPSGSPSYKSYFENIDFREQFKEAEGKVRITMNEYLKEEIELDLEKNSTSENEQNILNIADNIALLTEILEWKYQGLKYEWFDYVWANTFKKFKNEFEDKYIFLTPLADELRRAYELGVKPTNPFLTLQQHQSYKK